MKTYLLLLLFNLSYVLSAQDYTFDRLIQYDENGENIIQVYFNIDNPDYYLILKSGQQDGSATVYDLKQDMLHHYIVQPLQEENGLIYSFEFKDSEKHPFGYGSTNSIHHTFDLKRDDKYYRFGKLNLFHDKNQSDLILSADLVMRYSHEDLFPIFNTCCLLGDTYSRNSIDLGDNFVVVKASFIDKGGKEFVYKLVDDQVIQFSLKRPE